MNKIFTLFVCSLLIITTLQSQIQEVSIGPGYSQQAYYSLESGEVTTIGNEAWDIAFSAAGQQDAGVFYNESTTFMSSPMQLFVSSTTDWQESISDPSVFTDDLAIYNPELNWTEGAFNTVKDPTSPFDFGWGAYSPQTNIVEGNKIYVLKKRDGNFIKLQIQQLAGGIYTFRYADLDGNNEYNGSVNKSDTDGPLIYFSFDTNDEVAVPSEYDLVFQRYTTPLDAGDGIFIEYTVSGVLLAAGTEAVVALDVDPTNVDESDYNDQYSSAPKTIGHDWKSFDFTSGWLINENRTQFIKTASGDVYQVTFYDFQGSATGNTTFEKTFITTVSTENIVDDEFDFVVYPNPTTDYFYIKSDYNDNITYSLINTSGQVVHKGIAKPDEMIAINQLTRGMYMLQIQADGKSIRRNLVVN